MTQPLSITQGYTHSGASRMLRNSLKRDTVLHTARESASGEFFPPVRDTVRESRPIQIKFGTFSFSSMIGS